MAFSDLTSNQMVSDSNAATAGFPLKSGQSHSYIGVMLTKDAALAKFDLVTANMSSYSGNQLVPKSVMVGNAGQVVMLYISLQMLNLPPVSPIMINNEFTIYDMTTSTQVAIYSNIVYDGVYHYYEVPLYVGHTYFCQGELNENTSNSYGEINWYPSGNSAYVDVTYFEHCQTYDYGYAYEQVKFTINSADPNPDDAWLEVFGGGFIDETGTPSDTCAPLYQ